MNKQLASQKGGKAPMSKTQALPMSKTQALHIIKSKFGKQLGFRTSDHFKGKTFSGNKVVGFDAGRFKTQHKG